MADRSTADVDCEMFFFFPVKLCTLHSTSHISGVNLYFGRLNVTLFVDNLKSSINQNNEHSKTFLDNEINQ